MRPFIEVDGAVFIVEGWEPDQEERDLYAIRRLTEEEDRRYREARDEMDIELYMNFIGG